MTLLEEKNAELTALQTAFVKALKENDADAVAKSFQKLGEFHTKQLRNEFEAYKRSNDSAILEKAGITQYTSAEIKSFKNLIETQKDATVAVTVPVNAFPETFIMRIINEAVAESPLLQAVNITNCGFMATMILDESESDPATWSKMGQTISETNVELNTLPTQMLKLAKIIVVPREMLDMGPAWLLSYVIGRLKECFRLGMETGIVSGNGANSPIGMDKTKSKGTDAQGKYSLKTAVDVSDFKPTTYGELISKLVMNSKDRARNIEKVILVAHPITILTKIMPASCVRRPDGTYSEMIFPYPTVVIPSVSVDENKAILGIYGKYEFFISTGSSKNGKIEQDNSIHFAEHMSAFKIFCYANGSFVDENDFILLDLTNFKVANQEVFIVNDEEHPIPTVSQTTTPAEEQTNSEG